MSHPRFQFLEEDKVFDGHVFDVTVARFADSNGGTFTRDVVRHPGAVVVVPIHDDGTVTLVRQFRAPLGGDLLEAPAGTRDVDDESPETAAARELAEEVGYEADEFRLLNRCYNAPGYCDEELLIFAARGLHSVGNDTQGPEEEAMTIERHSIHDLLAMIERGELIDAKTIIAVLLLARATGDERT